MGKQRSEHDVMPGIFVTSKHSRCGLCVDVIGPGRRLGARELGRARGSGRSCSGRPLRLCDDHWQARPERSQLTAHQRVNWVALRWQLV